MEIGLTQNPETMALQNLTIVDLFLFFMCKDPTLLETYWTSILLRAQSHMTSHYTRGPVTTLHGFGSVLGQALGTSFWALIISRSQLSAQVWSGPLLKGVWVFHRNICNFYSNQMNSIDPNKNMLLHWHGYMFTTPKYHGKSGNDHLYLEYGVHICMFNSSIKV